MSKKDTNEVLNHEYDGIQEYDNPLPNWWLATFYGAIVFSFFYVAYYHFGPGLSPEKELEDEMAAIHLAQEKTKTVAPALSESDLLGIYNDSGKRQHGATVFKEKCASCHGAQGEGQIGPNLTDKFWLHGNGSLLALFKTIADGVPEKGMPPWKGMLKKDELLNVVAFAKGLKGTKPANPKPPQGTEVAEK
jgi:cytochrome c oxidase cbb3-type subunit 3